MPQKEVEEENIQCMSHKWGAHNFECVPTKSLPCLKESQGGYTAGGGGETFLLGAPLFY